MKIIKAWYTWAERNFITVIEPVSGSCPIDWSCYNSMRSFTERCEHLDSIIDEAKHLKDTRIFGGFNHNCEINCKFTDQPGQSDLNEE